ncbi:hypothetical protein CAPTEDRAFT_174217 [Capitella teleta]|uniref:Acyl-coenzyme A oxidase n=1 Tax=Capitella teleta TaxID=283909 RepID=R7TBL0_CAPTE|nr:hypothetical protein CAPTEDRAFT_174217 [Capitella teleta]|eukprot:ELT88872.1 hypothetical protein CAPTEDRAFT_174217 [Capitella teleta]
MGPYVNPDLQKERDGAGFDPENLTLELHGGVERVKTKRAMSAKALADLKVLDIPDFHFLSRTEQYNASMKKAVYFMKKDQNGSFANEEESYFYRNEMFPNENPPIGLQYAMFIPTLESQTSPEQKQRWLKDAKNFKMLGTYAQTEIGHGTHVRGLETTATYDPETEEFVLDSPTLTSIKWWPGSLGKTTNHAIVMADLLSQGKSHGVHPFMVQTRSMETHQPLPGVTIGDIGPKFGYGTIDNGFLKFDHFRIPRENMLMKYARVEKDGTFVKEAKNAKLNYGVMVAVRVGISLTVAAHGLAQACTIAIRYSCVRRQSELKPGGPEPQVLDYQTQQKKLFPLLASTYAYWFTGLQMLAVSNTIRAQIEAGNLHALSSGLKAYTTNGANLGIEACRLACGGHGYSLSSGFPKIYVHATPGATYEGENTVLYLQTARYLQKSVTTAQSGSTLRGSTSYLTENLPNKSAICQKVNIGCAIMAFKYRAMILVQQAAKRMSQLKASGKPHHEAWNLSAVPWVQAAEAHIEFYVVKTFAERISTVKDPATVSVLGHLFQLFACENILKNGKDYLMGGFMSSDQLQMLAEKSLNLLADIRPNAVALVDAFDYSDNMLGSILGRFDGDVYENLYKWAKASPLNKTEVSEAYHKHLRGLIHGQNSKL